MLLHILQGPMRERNGMIVKQRFQGIKVLIEPSNPFRHLPLRGETGERTLRYGMGNPGCPIHLGNPASHAITTFTVD